MYKAYSQKKVLRSLSRTGYVFLPLSQEQGIILKLFLVRIRVRLLESQMHTPTLKFGECPPSLELLPFAGCMKLTIA